MKNFMNLMQPITQAIAKTAIDDALQIELNRQFPPQSESFRNIETACHEAIADGWMCAQGGEGRRFGRVVEPSPQTGSLSIDVVQLDSITGPHHAHPKGEICMVMPQDKTATFDGNGAGWCVYPPGSSHFPTVRGGSALILYLLPDGEIEFTGVEKDVADD